MRGSDGTGGIVAVVLAAGGGSRFAGPGHKLVAPFATSSVVCEAVDAARSAEIGPVYVVSGAIELPSIDDVTVIHNPRWQEGQATSIAAALDTATALGARAVVVGLGDQPLVGAAAWRAVAEASGGPVVVATYGGRRRPPVRLDAAVWPLVPRSGDEGARLVMRMHPELVTEVAVTGDPLDIDTVEDLHRWS